MPGYDTVVCARPATFNGSLPWGKSVETLSGQAVIRRHLARLNDVATIEHASREVDGREVYSLLSLQASLPKVLWGQNVDELREPLFVAKAVEQVEADLSAFLGETADLWTWRLQRVDWTHNLGLGNQAHVAAALQRLAYVRYRGTLPVRGQAQSVTWPAKKGGFAKVAYSKRDESDLAIADGVLRGETRAIGQRAARRAFQREQAVLLADLMTREALEAGERATTWLRGAMSKAVESVPVEVMEAIERFRAKSHRPSTVARLLGYSVMVQVYGEDYLVKSGMLTRQAAWLIGKEFAAAGVNPREIEFPGGPEDLSDLLEDEVQQAIADPEGFANEAVAMVEDLDGEPVLDHEDLVERVAPEALAPREGAA